MTPNFSNLKSQPFYSQSSKSLVKKLDLANLKQSFQIRDYHEEFMGMKEGFGESWKRESEKERKFWAFIDSQKKGSIERLSADISAINIFSLFLSLLVASL